MQADDLDTLTAQFPDCIIAAFADITTGVVFLTSGQAEAPREALNELCAEAALTLGEPEAPAIGAAPAPVAIKIVDHAVFLYAQAGEDPGDALLFMCRPTIALGPFVEAVRHLCSEAA